MSAWSTKVFLQWNLDIWKGLEIHPSALDGHTIRKQSTKPLATQYKWHPRIRRWYVDGCRRELFYLMERVSNRNESRYSLSFGAWRRIEKEELDP